MAAHIMRKILVHIYILQNHPQININKRKEEKTIRNAKKFEYHQFERPEPELKSKMPCQTP